MAKAGKRAGACVFCGTYGLLTREDATPKWVGRLLHKHFPPSGSWEAVELRPCPDGTLHSRSRRVGSPSAYKPVIVCASCNNTWMSGLEQSVRRTLAALILDQAAGLDAKASTMLATWAVKTALVYEFVIPSEEGTTASLEDRRWVCEQRKPLPESQVWLGRYVGTRGAHIVSRQTLYLFDRDDAESTPVAHTLFVVLVFGHLAIRVVLPRTDQLYPVKYAVAVGSFAQRIWPYERPVTWPPPASLDDSGLDTFMAVRGPSYLVGPRSNHPPATQP